MSTIIDPQSVSDTVKALTRQILIQSGLGLGCDDLVMQLWQHIAHLEANQFDPKIMPAYKKAYEASQEDLLPALYTFFKTFGQIYDPTNWDDGD